MARWPRFVAPRNIEGFTLAVSDALGFPDF
jgi:hypothetical protein